MAENKNIIAALLKAQSEMMSAKKDKKNPFFKSTYATLNAVWEAAKEPLHNNDLVLLQPIDIVDGKQVVKTLLMHTSGEIMTSNCPIVCSKQNDPQALGSAITYARRYSLASILGIMTDEDDDGEKAMSRKKSEPKKEKPVEFNYEDLISEIFNAKSVKQVNYYYHQWKQLGEKDNMYKQLQKLSGNVKNKLENPELTVVVEDGLDEFVKNVLRLELDDSLPDNVKEIG